MANYPMIFESSADAVSGIGSDWKTTSEEGREISCSVPSQFGGPTSGFSPEDLYLAALANCYIATLKVIATNSKMSFAKIEAKARLTLDQDGQAPTPWMKKAELKFKAMGVENPDRFKRLMERVSKQCMIINSVKTQIEFEFEVET